jgi:hypothetical protein
VTKKPIFDNAAREVQIKARYHEALQVAEKKAALGADNTENGKPNHFNSSIAIILSNVKKEGEFA